MFAVQMNVPFVKFQYRDLKVLRILYLQANPRKDSFPIESSKIFGKLFAQWKTHCPKTSSFFYNKAVFPHSREISFPVPSGSSLSTKLRGSSFPTWKLSFHNLLSHREAPFLQGSSFRTGSREGPFLLESSFRIGKLFCTWKIPTY